MKNNEYSIITKKYSKNIWRKYIKCVEEYDLIETGDIIFVLMSGQKNSNEYLCQMLLNMSKIFKMYDIDVIVGEDLALMEQYNCNKLVMPENFEDIADNTLWEMLYNGRISAYLPKEKKDKYTIIRPLYLIHTEDILKYYEEVEEKKDEKLFEKTQKEQELNYVRSIIDRLSANNESVGNNVFGSITNVEVDMLPGYILKDKRHDSSEAD